MSKGLNISIKGLDETLAKLDIKKFEKVIESEIHTFGLNVEQDAKQLCPVDEGHLKGSVFQEPKRLGVEVGVRANYAAYVEFGTRKFATAYVSTLPSDWQAYASQFKGKGGGSMDEFIQSIMAWVLRKGIGGGRTTGGNLSRSRSSDDAMQQAAYNIALYILRNGIKAQPFLYPAFEENRIILIKNLKELLNA